MASRPADAWRGVAAEDLDDLPAEVSARYRRRSRRLLASLLAPRRGPLLLALGWILVRTGGTLAIPYLVGQAIDHGIRAGRPAELELYAALVVVAAAAAGLGNWAFLRVAGRIGQDFLYDVRMRIYTHVQALSISFYERYTSGRIISRLTNDIDTLTDLLATGLTSLATATLSIAAIAVVLLLLDWRLGAVTLLTFPLILLLTHWFRANSSRAYRAVRQAIALVIVHFTESLGGIRAVQAYSR
ncbi:MAG: ABC transporter transmembrane domain-containing protein, partial [Candidatus Dormibacteraeota bacterium]|nr:ABC transporter transmembrane domain-containing protein [Candidatus Dormibacteraeota bacterium]